MASTDELVRAHHAAPQHPPAPPLPPPARTGLQHGRQHGARGVRAVRHHRVQAARGARVVGAHARRHLRTPHATTPTTRKALLGTPPAGAPPGSRDDSHPRPKPSQALAHRQHHVGEGHGLPEAGEEQRVVGGAAPHVPHQHGQHALLVRVALKLHGGVAVNAVQVARDEPVHGDGVQHLEGLRRQQRAALLARRPHLRSLASAMQAQWRPSPGVPAAASRCCLFAVAPASP